MSDGAGTSSGAGTNLDSAPGGLPPWWDGKRIRINRFVSWYASEHPMKCIDGRFCTVDGEIDRDGIEKDVFDIVCRYYEYDPASVTKVILDNLAMYCREEAPEPDPTKVHVTNGTIDLAAKRFTPEKEFCRNRLPVRYLGRNAVKPERWLKFLDELLYQEDIPIFQEYMGYCLIPTTKAQKMLMIIGKGGEGKSCIGAVLKRMFGDGMNTSSIQKIEENRFARADLENKLLMLDDDINMGALKSTNMIKTIVTADGPMDIERKGVQSCQRVLYSRFICLGNGALQSLYDHSRGFYRRQIILTTKDRPADRVDDPYMDQNLCEEIDGIFAWCLEGLIRLLKNDFRFTASERAEKNLREVMSDGINIVDFLQDEGYVKYDRDASISTKDLYWVYKTWCDDNALTPLGSKTFTNYLSQHREELGIEPARVYLRTGNKVRGYSGISQA